MKPTKEFYHGPVAFTKDELNYLKQVLERQPEEERQISILQKLTLLLPQVTHD